MTDQPPPHDPRALAHRDLATVTVRLPGQTTDELRRLLTDAWAFGLRSGFIRPVAGDIGEPHREVTFEPLPDTVPVPLPVPEPAPAVPAGPVPA